MTNRATCCSVFYMDTNQNAPYAPFSSNPFSALSVSMLCTALAHLNALDLYDDPEFAKIANWLFQAITEKKGGASNLMLLACKLSDFFNQIPGR